MKLKNYTFYNHISPGLSDMEKDMLNFIPPGGNWKNLPDRYDSKRLNQIRKTGGRTTYYGKLTTNKPSYTITTYFNRLPNGCNIHPTQNRIISIREGARLQSFPDKYEFISSKSSQYKQIGNAVPPLLGRFIASQLKKQVKNKSIFDLFAGAGGMSEGFLMEGFQIGGANEVIENYFSTFIHNHRRILKKENCILGDITNDQIKHNIVTAAKSANIGIIIGGPPCQGFSHAGWRDPNDTRNQLFRDYLAVVNEVQPEIFVMENVPGLMSMNKGATIADIRNSFKAIGYKTLSPFMLKAEEFGAPQKRKRLILIGYKKKKLSLSLKPLFSYKDIDLPDPINVGESIGSLPELGIKDGVNPYTCDYMPISAYDYLMSGQINFDEFYEKAKERPKSRTPLQRNLI